MATNQEKIEALKQSIEIVEATSLAYDGMLEALDEILQELQDEELKK